MNNNKHLNFIILSDGKKYYLFERLGKKVPFEAYNKSKSLKIGDSIDEILGKSSIDLPKNTETDSPKNQGSPVSVSLGSSMPRMFEIEKHPYEVIFND